MDNLISIAKQLLREHEGFRQKAYLDHLGNPTFGYGFTWITKEESEVLLSFRVEKLNKELLNFYWYENIDNIRKSAILDMAYQLGVSGVNKFKKTIIFLKENEYKKASIEMLNSKWAKQTPNRAKEISEIIRTGGIE